ncbi:hypothetical protein CYMTET_56944 [Cymbomonas tetramitiformis]|uniref:Fe2OG dioxygenase domain-containing protein n=1 Tax=Cymbomonas tetramitiformis TaxID=36881 RepID=A0AAE0BAA7_9CHLO|nr:hypothetical protein CYMTET_56944 [Cymbomonas tetramitiformis]
MEQGDPDHKRRTKTLIGNLKSILGEKYSDFKAESIRFQHGETSANEYLKTARTLLIADDVLREMALLLPHTEKRSELLKFMDLGIEASKPSQQILRCPPSDGVKRSDTKSTHQSGSLRYRPSAGEEPTLHCSAQQKPAHQRGPLRYEASAEEVPTLDCSAQQVRGRSTHLPTASNSAAPSAHFAAPRKKARVQVLQPGLVLLKGALDIATQIYLVQEAFRLGDGSNESGGGFYSEENPEERATPCFKLNMGSRGRLIDTIQSFPDRFREICLECLQQGMAADENLTEMDPTTLLLNFYKENAEFKWHKDSEDPELVRQRLGKTIVSFTVGLSANFGYKMSFESEEHGTVRLDSGDVLLFGGPSRMIVHSVLRVIPKTMPPQLRGKMRTGRLNVTFRDVGCGSIDVTQFPRYRVSYDTETG